VQERNEPNAGLGGETLAWIEQSPPETQARHGDSGRDTLRNQGDGLPDETELALQDPGDVIRGTAGELVHSPTVPDTTKRERAPAGRCV
jgi:hypothetical protein